MGPSKDAQASLSLLSHPRSPPPPTLTYLSSRLSALYSLHLPRPPLPLTTSLLYPNPVFITVPEPDLANQPRKLAPIHIPSCRPAPHATTPTPLPFPLPLPHPQLRPHAYLFHPRRCARCNLPNTVLPHRTTTATDFFASSAIDRQFCDSRRAV
jgi:hypothetical protein